MDIFLEEETKVERARAEFKEKTARLHEAVRVLMSMREGRDFLREFINKCGVLSVDSSLEGNHLSFMAGRRSIGVELIALINNADPKNFSKLMEAENG